MLQEQDTCRICSGPGEEEQPLFYPCKCSGTIRYIHQDCLKTWLDHSKKTTCDVCKHPYAFTKVYARDMPDRVPVTILIRKFVEQVAAVILFMLRATLVAFVWLILLPYGTVLTWRLYFRMGDVLAWGISLHTRPGALNATQPTSQNHTPSAMSLSDVSFQPYLRTLSADIFTGQIIASLIVLAFLAVFLLREWIQQNALPGVFDDAPAGEVPPPEPQPQGDVDQAELAANVHDEADAEAPVPLDAAERPVPDVPEDVRTASPVSTSSMSSTEPEDVPSRPDYVAEVDRLPFSDRRRRVKVFEASKGRVRRTTGVTKATRGDVRRRQRAVGGHGLNMDADVLPGDRPRDEEGELQHNDPSGSRKRSRVYGDLGKAGASSAELSRSEHNELPESQSQKGKGDESDNEWVDTRSVTAERSHSPMPSGFEFTFHIPQSSPQPSEFPSTFAPPQNGGFKFKLEPKPNMSASPDLPGSREKKFEFTFRHPKSSPQSSAVPPTFALPRNGEFKFNLDSRPNISVPSFLGKEPPSNPSSSLTGTIHHGSQPFELPPPSETRATLAELPHPFTPRTSTSSSNHPALGPLEGPSAPQSTVTPILVSPSVPSTPLRRPPLPTTTMPPLESANAEASSSTSVGDATVPLPSPHHAIYRPPEELGLDDDEYFGNGARSNPLPRDVEDDEDEARYEYFFKEPDLDDAKEFPPPLMLPDTDEEEEEEDPHDAEEGRDEEPHMDEDAPLAERGDLDPEAAAENVVEEREQNLEEDLDGAMEAVGLRGPVFAVFQNAALMLFILNVSIGGAVWFPFTLGKTVSLLTLEPRRALQIIHLPIRAVRLATDPSVDIIIYALRFISITLLDWGKLIYPWILQAINFVGAGAAQERLLGLYHRIDLRPIKTLFMHTRDTGTFVSPIDHSSFWNMTGEHFLSHVRSNPAISSFVNSVSEGPAFVFAEERFAILGRHVRLGLTSAWKGWVNIVEGDGTVERLSAIFIGYAIVAFLAALYLNTFTVGNVKSVGRAVRNAIRQQMIVLKVALFIIVELVMFPFGCGTMLDFSTLALFPDASIESRLAFFSYAPITAAFYHWLIGTMFMYQFAILLATCREILRPGCMWFIKDPQDPTFHPIRDILDRPTFAQLRKLCMSAIMYAFVITLGVGCVVGGLNVITPLVLPLRWKMREPLSEIPVDLLFVHLILPPTLHYFRPRKTVRRLMTSWWQWTARQLRLTSFMFGGRHRNEEYTATHWSLRALFSNDNEELMDLEATPDGSFRRVPAGDNIAFLRDKPALVQVDENGIALDEEGEAVMLAQNAEAEQAGRDYRQDYTVVYVPPHFRRRILSFIALFWISGSAAMMSALFVPILLGRAIFGLFTSRVMHDGYSFVVGFYLLWWGWLVGILIVRIRIRRQRHSGSRRIRAGWFLFLFKRVFVYFTKVLWMVFWLGIVLPTLVSIALDLYVVIPLRYFVDPNFTPTLHIVESWATGLLISKVIIITQRVRPGNDLFGALETIQRNGWRRPDPLAATRDFIMPVAMGLIGMILLPPLVLYGCDKFASSPWQMKDLFRLVYPSIFVGVAASQFAMSLVGIFGKWTQSIRDKEFLVELRLRNLENPRKGGKADSANVKLEIKREEEMQRGEEDEEDEEI